MSSALPINLADLLYQRVVEAPRIELKGSWNEGPTGQQVLRTICAFANDLHHLNGGYIVLGVEERDGAAVLPPKGLDPRRIEGIQKWIRGNCRRLDPEYQPVQSPEIFQDRHILVLWAPASEIRPHSAPVSRGSKERELYVRLGAETVAARGPLRTQLLEMTAKVPFDDRPARRFTLADLRATLVREFLREIGSALVDERQDFELYRRLRLTSRLNDHEVPRNVGLMFFSDEPEQAFRGARIEVVHFAGGGDVLEERVFGGPLHRQLRDSLGFLGPRIAHHIEKLPDRAETHNWDDYPFAALEETIVNAVYHRSYEAPAEPVKVYVYDDRIEVTSYPGPVPGLEAEHFLPRAELPQVTARNRRIGELLKDLRMAEARGTGLIKIHRAMAANGSPPPTFRFDPDRTYFTVVLPIHPAAAPRRQESPAASGSDGLILISAGGESIRPQVEESLAELGLTGSQVLVDFTVSPAADPAAPDWEEEARRIRDLVQRGIEDSAVARLHLFYRGPVVLASVLGALVAASGKPLCLYDHRAGRYSLALTMSPRVPDISLSG